MKTFTVTQINSYIKDLFQSDLALKSVKVSGEISDLTINTFSDHAYFTLKDASSQLKAVFFSGSRKKSRLPLKNGMKITASGKIDVYEPSGQYQLIVYSAKEEGMGDLLEEFLEKKQRLEKEGLFALEYKKPLPAYPKTIGVITSETGAVLRDIVRTAWRRNPGVTIILAPATVQGSEAPESLIAALKQMEAIAQVETVIIGRGGGSFEDLNCFNNEKLARAIFAFSKPIISAVGHETDFTIADFVADMRAATPTAAAELAVPDIAALKEELTVLRNYLDRQLEYFLKTKQSQLSAMSLRLRDLSPQHILENRRQQLDMLCDILNRATENKFSMLRSRLAFLETKVKANNPSAPLEKGYAWVAGSDGKIIKDIKHLSPGKEIGIFLKGGKARAQIVEIMGKG